MEVPIKAFSGQCDTYTVREPNGRLAGSPMACPEFRHLNHGDTSPRSRGGPGRSMREAELARSGSRSARHDPTARRAAARNARAAATDPAAQRHLRWPPRHCGPCHRAPDEDAAHRPPCTPFQNTSNGPAAHSGRGERHGPELAGGSRAGGCQRPAGPVGQLPHPAVAAAEEHPRGASARRPATGAPLITPPRLRGTRARLTGAQERRPDVMRRWSSRARPRRRPRWAARWRAGRRPAGPCPGWPGRLQPWPRRRVHVPQRPAGARALPEDLDHAVAVLDRRRQRRPGAPPSRCGPLQPRPGCTGRATGGRRPSPSRTRRSPRWAGRRPAARCPGRPSAAICCRPLPAVARPGATSHRAPPRPR